MQIEGFILRLRYLLLLTMTGWHTKKNHETRHHQQHTAQLWRHGQQYLAAFVSSFFIAEGKECKIKAAKRCIRFDTLLRAGRKKKDIHHMANGNAMQMERCDSISV